jgi:predicted  nucleic acid-binding Zn-ribbon protein
LELKEYENGLKTGDADRLRATLDDVQAHRHKLDQICKDQIGISKELNDMMQKSVEISQDQKRQRIAAEAKAAVAEIDLETANNHINTLESQVVELKHKLEEVSKQLYAVACETTEPEAAKFALSYLILTFQ